MIALIIYIFSPRNYIYTCFLYYIFAVFIFVYLHNAFLVSWTWLKSQPIHYIKTQICFNIRRTVYSDKPSYSRSVQNYVIIQGLSITCQNIQTFAQVRTEWITNRTMFIQWNLPLSVLQVIERHFFWIIYQIVLQNISLAMPELSSVPYTGTYLCRTYYFLQKLVIFLINNQLPFSITFYLYFTYMLNLYYHFACTCGLCFNSFWNFICA